MSNDMDNYKHNKTCGECFDKDCPSRLNKRDDRADLRCFAEAPRTQDSSGSTELVGCEAGCDFEMMLRRLVAAMANKDIKTTICSRNVAKVRKQAEDLLKRKGHKNGFLR